MMPRLTIALIIPALLLAAAPARADVSEFSSYDECILESLKGVSSDVAASAIIASCRSTFPETAPAAVVEPVPAPEPEPQPEEAQPASAPPEAPQAQAKPEPASAEESRELTQEELNKLKATLLGFLSKYRVTFENMNEDITVTEVTIAVWDDLDPRGLKKYTQTMNIPPGEEQKVEYEVIYMGDDQGWRWKVDSAKGVPVVY